MEGLGSLLKEVGSPYVWKDSRFDSEGTEDIFKVGSGHRACLLPTWTSIWNLKGSVGSAKASAEQASLVQEGLVPRADLEPLGGGCGFRIMGLTPCSLCHLAVSTLETSGSQLWLVSSLWTGT